MRYLFIVFCFFSSTYLFSQNTFEIVIEDTATFPRSRISYDALEVYDGFLLTSTLNSKEDFALTKIDKQGNILWDKTFEVGTWPEFKPYIIETNIKNEYIIAFQSFSFQNISATTTLTVVYKINEKGEILWENIIENAHSINKLILLPNNKILIDSWQVPNSLHKFFILNNNGELLKEITLTKPDAFYVKDLIIIDNFIYLCGAYDGDTQTAFLDKYDLNVNLIYSTGLYYGDLYHQRIMKVFNKEDNYYFITADRELFQFDPLTGIYDKLDEDFANENNAQNNVNAYQARVEQFVLTSNDEILAYSPHGIDNNLSPYGISKGAMIEMYDDEYKLKWYKYYVKGEFLDFKDILETSDGGLLFYGHYNPFYEEGSSFSSSKRLYVLKTDCEGNKEWSADACYVPQIVDLTIFPNPFQDVLKIQIPNLSDIDNYKIKLFNKLGQQIINQQITNKITAVNTILLSDGIYFYTITNNNKIIEQGKVLKN